MLQIVNQRKDDFYNNYNYLKPECEKSGWEKFCDGCKSVGNGVNRPNILFGDEPTGVLDSSSTKEVMDILEQINYSGTTILLVTHDAKVAARADRIIYLEDGKIKDEFRRKKVEKKS